jgi:hypothetical protein
LFFPATSQILPLLTYIQDVKKEIKVYTLDDHLQRRGEVIKAIFEKLQQAILDMNPEIKEKVMKKYIAYEMKRNFTEFVIQSLAVKVYLDIPIQELKDTAHIAKIAVT